MTKAKTEPKENKLILYVLMRTDLPDFKTGKCMAQANHAGTAFMEYVKKFPDDELISRSRWWLDEGGGFGTCVVLGVTSRQLPRLIDIAKVFQMPAEIVHDPSYPILDGHIVQTLPVDTCGFVFGWSNDCALFLNDLKLID